MTFFCSACCMGKAHKLHSSTSHTTYTKPLLLIYTDLWEPSPSASTSGFHYYMSFIYVYSKFTWLYLLENKSEALIIFKQFKTMVELQHDLPIKVASSNWKGEF